MWRPSAALLTACAGVLAGCSTAAPAPTPDISRVAEVKSALGPSFTVKDFPRSGIDPKLLGNQQLPQGLTFTPADRAALASGQGLPPGLEGNMAATYAEGEGNRFIVIAIETSQAVTPDAPGESCRKVEFAGGALRGVVEVVEAPQIPDTRTLGTHRMVQQVVRGGTATGELYNYVARFGNHQVIVVADPLIQPGRPVTPVNTAKARELLSTAVADVRG